MQNLITTQQYWSVSKFEKNIYTKHIKIKWNNCKNKTVKATHECERRKNSSENTAKIVTLLLQINLRKYKTKTKSGNENGNTGKIFWCIPEFLSNFLKFLYYNF